MAWQGTNKMFVCELSQTLMLFSPRLEEVIMFLWLLFHLKSFYKAENVRYHYDMFTFVFTCKKKKKN